MAAHRPQRVSAALAAGELHPVLLVGPVLGSLQGQHFQSEAKVGWLQSHFSRSACHSVCHQALVFTVGY